MGEVRKPDTVVRVRRKGSATKFELFSALQFPTEEFDNSDGDPVILNQRGRYYRVRIDGVWVPLGSKRLYTQTQCHELIRGVMFE
jgi:hypothetical protein